MRKYHLVGKYADPFVVVIRFVDAGLSNFGRAFRAWENAYAYYRNLVKITKGERCIVLSKGYRTIMKLETSLYHQFGTDCEEFI